MGIYAMRHSLPVLLGIFLIAVSLRSMTAAEPPQPLDITVDLSDLGKPFRGWGTSLAWWAHGVGSWSDEAVNRIVHLITDPNEGLGLTVFRYNIGGGDAPGHHHFRHWGDVPGFKSSASAPYEWSADESQRNVLLKLVKAAGSDGIVEGFSNSAPWWMTVSGCAGGAVDGGPNLKPKSEEAFADYLADVAEHYRHTLGVTFSSLEPFNEPDSAWWKERGNQEGMAVPHEQQARLIRLLRSKLDSRGMHSTAVSAPDDNSITGTIDALSSYDGKTLAALGQVNTHSYFGSDRDKLRELAAADGKPIWQSETGPLKVSGPEYGKIMTVARRIIQDFNGLHPEVWCMWQVVASGAWGCLQDDPATQGAPPRKLFHVMATFTRAIRPGDRFVNLRNDTILASVSPKRGEAVLVVVNPDKKQRLVRIHLRGGVLPSSATCTVTTQTKDLQSMPALPIRDGLLELATESESVTRLSFPLRPRG